MQGLRGTAGIDSLAPVLARYTTKDGGRRWTGAPWLDRTFRSGHRLDPKPFQNGGEGRVLVEPFAQL